MHSKIPIVQTNPNLLLPHLVQHRLVSLQIQVLSFLHRILLFILNLMQFLRTIASFITKPLVLLHIILIIQWGLFLATTIHPYTINTPNRTYLMVRGHLLYSSYIRQSKEGAWSLINPHTTRPSPRAY